MKKENAGLFSSLIGVLMNVILFIIKFVVGRLFNSVSIMADAMNNFSDLLSSVIAMVGFKLGEKPADQEHPFGHERFEYISGFLMSIMMLFIGFDLFKTGFNALLNNTVVILDNKMILVMLISMAIKGFLYFFYKHNYKKTESEVIYAAQLDSRNDVLINIVILLGFYVNQMLSFNVDGILGIGIALFIMASSISLLKDFIDELVGYRPNQELINKVIQSVIEEPDVFSYHDLLIHEYGDSTYYGTIHLEVDQRISLIAAHEIAHHVEHKVFVNTGVELVVHLDPIDIVSDEIKRIHLSIKQALKLVDTSLEFHDLRVKDNVIEVDVVIGEESDALESKIIAALKSLLNSNYILDVTFDTVQFKQTSEDDK